MKTTAKKFSLIIAILLMAGVSFVAGLYMNPDRVNANASIVNIFNRESDISDKLDFNDFWKVWRIMEEKHVFSGTASSTPDQEKIYGAIEGLVASLKDPYSEFMPPEKREQFNEELSGTLEGVGMEVGIRDELLTVVAPIKNSPAEKAGIRAGDVILAIDGKDAVKLGVSEAVKLIRGKKGTTVVITIGRKGEAPKEVSIVRDTIVIPTLEAKVVNKEIFVITLDEFNAVSTSLFKQAMAEFYKGKYKKLVLDLRNNPGGYLDAAVDMASYFLPAGKVVVTEDYGNKREKVVHRSKGYQTFDPNMKMVVLINEGSASASEILAGALSDHGIATLVGTKSFGKGSVQELIPITKDTSLKLTVAAWVTPDGKSIAHEGLTPAVVIKPTEEDIKNEKDVQYEKALKLVK